MGKSYKQEKVRSSDDRKNERQLKKEAKFDKKERRKGKWSGNNSYDVVELSKVLAADGLTIRHMDGDGNCLFRSIADQMTGNQELHLAFRKRIMKYIEEHGDHFRLFMEDDESFEAYMTRMSEDGEWGGHQELYAASQCLNVNITVYQLNAPSYILPANIEGKTAKDAKPPKNIRISYHGDCHYNSVHPTGNGADKGPQTDENTSTNSAAGNTTPGAKCNIYIPDSDVTLVLQSVPWLAREQVTAALELKGGDVDAAVEYLCAEVEELSIDTPPSVKSCDKAEGTNAGTVVGTERNVERTDSAVDEVVGVPAEAGTTTVAASGPAATASVVVDASHHTIGTSAKVPAAARQEDESVRCVEPATTTGSSAGSSHPRANKLNTKVKDAIAGTEKKENSYRKSGQNAKSLSKKVSYGDWFVLPLSNCLTFSEWHCAGEASLRKATTKWLIKARSGPR